MEPRPVTTSWVRRSTTPPGYRALMFGPPFLILVLAGVVYALFHPSSVGLAALSLAFYPAVLIPWYFVVMEIQDRRRFAISVRSDTRGIEVRMPSRSPSIRFPWGDVRAISETGEAALWRLAYADRSEANGERFVLITREQGEALRLEPSAPPRPRVP